MSSKSTQKQNVNNSLDPWSQQQYTGIANDILSFADQPVQAYGADLTPGLDPLQLQASQMAGQNIGAGQNTLGQAINMAGSVGGYQPQNVQAGQLNGMDLSGYLNPYLDTVAGNYIDKMDEGRRRALVSNSQAAGPGAWGGSRHGVADSLTSEAFGDALSQGLSGIYSQGFNQAQGAAQSDIANSLNAALANQSAGLQNAGLGLSASNLLGQFGQQQQQMGANDALLLNQFGQQSYGVDQASLSAAYQEWLRQQQVPFQQAGLELGVLGSTPMIQDSKSKTTTSQSVSPAALISAGLQAASMFANPAAGVASSAAGAAGAGGSMGAMLPFAAFSDYRLKEDFEHVLTDGNGLDWFDYTFKPTGERQRGVIAQQVALLKPEAVMRHPSGFLMVDYGAL